MAVTACPPAGSASRTHPAGILAALATTVLLLLTVPAGQARAGPTCDLYADPAGSDSAPGTLTQPFASIQHLSDALSVGQTGCVRGGVYTQDVTITHAGAPAAPITITSYPGERATLTGRLWVHQGADYVIVSGMNLNGKNASDLPSPDINAAHTTFTANDVTNEHTAICFDLGSDTTYGRASDTIIKGNRIHDCGTLPAGNHDHGIYVESSTGAQILENVIYNNADRGIQLYPDAQQTVVERNIVDSNGEGIIFSGDFGTASDNNTVAHNLITNAKLRDNLESWYPAGNPTGQGNAVHDNCVWGGAKGIIETPETGFTATNNTTANPQYVNPSAGDYRISSSTGPCAALLANTTTPTQPFATTITNTTNGTSGTSGSSGETIAPTTPLGTSGTSGSSGETIAPTTSLGTSSTATTSTGASSSRTTTTKHHHHHSARTAVAARTRVAVNHRKRHHGHHMRKRAAAHRRSVKR
jgi:parallel beta-helix repeat protein